ncbi:protocadherin gamma-A11-like, partial [Mustela nigripes]|uniref:protocadherin gamma-A11-like n=1 Tax=Mustela nigripes TaxID=77151 RepID=UPI002814D10A
MGNPPLRLDRSGLVLLHLFLRTLQESGAGHIQYSVPEETDKGFFVGNISKDLELEPWELLERGVRIISRDRMQLFALNLRSGSLITAGTVIALLNVQDQDSGENGRVSCFVPNSLPFKLEKTYGNYYKLITTRMLDREQVHSYNITLIATDQGFPPLSTETHISLNIADDNDNPPTFADSSYSIYIPENNARGASFFSVMAVDLDSSENSQITYSLVEDTLQGAPLSTYISINSNTGTLYALRSFDYEQFRDLQLWVTAQDSGKPPLSSNVSVNIFVLDQNDNAPEILYPTLPTDGSTGVELAPRSAEPGYLVTKVVAVDRDSGQNAWLSYRLLKASEPGLFAVGLHTGEVRTARALLDRDALKQSLVVAVQDHGQPPLSATVTLTVAVADSIPDVLADLGSIGTPAD